MGEGNSARNGRVEGVLGWRGRGVVWCLKWCANAAARDGCGYEAACGSANFSQTLILRLDSTRPLRPPKLGTAQSTSPRRTLSLSPALIHLQATVFISSHHRCVIKAASGSFHHSFLCFDASVTWVYHQTAERWITPPFGLDSLPTDWKWRRDHSLLF